MPFIDLNKTELVACGMFDITIIGAGAAGILLALKLASAGKTVCVIESGGMEYNASKQGLNKLQQTGKFLSNVMEGRRRIVGGTTTAWGGQSLPFSNFDFLPVNPFDLTKTFIFKPKLECLNRVYNQKSWFTSHCLNEIDKFLPFNKQVITQCSLTKLRIPNSKFSLMRDELHKKNNISAETLFESIDKMCDDINKSFAPD